MFHLRLVAAAALIAAVAGLLWPASVGGHPQTVAAETLTVSNTSTTPVQSETVLDSSHKYRITASGTVSDWCPPTATKPADCSFGSPLEIGQGVDAIYCYATWRCGSTPQAWRQLRVNNQGLDEFAGQADKIPYDAGHSYTVDVTGVSGKLTFDHADGSPSDNSGAWTVTITDLGPAGGQCKVLAAAESCSATTTIRFRFTGAAVSRIHPHELGDVIEVRAAGSGVLKFTGALDAGKSHDANVIGSHRVLVEKELSGVGASPLRLRILHATYEYNGPVQYIDLEVKVVSASGRQTACIGDSATMLLDDLGGRGADRFTAPYCDAGHLRGLRYLQNWKNANTRDVGVSVAITATPKPTG